MWKKLLVFSSAFCLSLFLVQLLKPIVQTDSIEASSNPPISNNLSKIKTEYEISVEFRFFTDLFNKFQKAVAKNDKKTVSSLVYFPIDIEIVGKKNKLYKKRIKSEIEFLQNYDVILDNSFKQCISGISKNELILLDNSTLSVHQKGKIVIRIDRYYKSDSRSFEVKIFDLLRC